MGRIAVVLVALLTVSLTAQQGVPAFEVASVRPSTNESGPPTFSAPSRGTTVITNGSLRDIIPAAFGIPFYLAKFKFDDGERHNEVLNSRFDIIAKPPDNAPPGQAIVMLRRLLSAATALQSAAEVV